MMHVACFIRTLTDQDRVNVYNSILHNTARAICKGMIVNLFLMKIFYQHRKKILKFYILQMFVNSDELMFDEKSKHAL